MYISTDIVKKHYAHINVDTSMTNIYDKPVMVDPPSGYLYGFPKLYSKTEHPNFYTWIVQEGYPQEEIDKYEGQFYCRFWYPEERQ